MTFIVSVSWTGAKFCCLKEGIPQKVSMRVPLSTWWFFLLCFVTKTRVLNVCLLYNTAWWSHIYMCVSQTSPRALYLTSLHCLCGSLLVASSPKHIAALLSWNVGTNPLKSPTSQECFSSFRGELRPKICLLRKGLIAWHRDKTEMQAWSIPWKYYIHTKATQLTMPLILPIWVQTERKTRFSSSSILKLCIIYTPNKVRLKE